MRMYNSIRCLVVCAFLCALIGISHCANFKFHHLSGKDGLSNNPAGVRGASFHQDDNGFIWIATQDSLNWFEGYEFKTYKHDPQDHSSLSDSFVTYLFEYSIGTLWIGTTLGLNRFDAKTEKFQRYLPKKVSFKRYEQWISYVYRRRKRGWFMGKYYGERAILCG